MATSHSIAVSEILQPRPNRKSILIYRPKPRRSAKANARAWQGTVTVSFYIDPEGRVLNPKIVDTSGDNKFRRVTLKAVARARYEPRFINGKPVSSHNVQTKFKFNLAN